MCPQIDISVFVSLVRLILTGLPLFLEFYLGGFRCIITYLPLSPTYNRSTAEILAPAEVRSESANHFSTSLIQLEYSTSLESSPVAPLEESKVLIKIEQAFQNIWIHPINLQIGSSFYTPYLVNYYIHDENRIIYI